VIIIKFEYEIGNVDYDDFLLELKSIYSMLKENEELETLSKRDSPHLEKDSAFKPIRLLD